MEPIEEPRPDIEIHTEFYRIAIQSQKRIVSALEVITWLLVTIVAMLGYIISQRS